MYHNYFGLKEQAFSIAVNPRYLYMSQQHKEALAHLLYGVKGGGFVLLSGEVGTGKTTIIRCLLEQLPENTDIAIVLNPMADVVDMLCTICDELGAKYLNDTTNIKSLTDALHEYLLDNHRRGHNTVLLIDEAQLLSPEALEQIRLLTNLETTTQKLLQIILVGQPEINELLAQPRLRQLSQRITARFHLTPLTLEETEAYINHRLEVAGMPEGRKLYTHQIIRKIHTFTGGIPRLINIVCERTLIGAYGHNTQEISKDIFELARSEVAGSMDYLPSRRKAINWRPIAIGGAAVAAVFVVALLINLLFFRPNLPATGNSTQTTATLSREQQNTEIAPTQPTPLPTPIVKVESENLRSQLIASARTAPSTQKRLGSLFEYRQDNYSEAQADLVRYLGHDVSSDTHPCWELTRERIQCKTLELATWDSLRDLNRPAVLELTTPDKFITHAIITGMSQTQAQLLTPQGVLVLTPLMELGHMWTGKTFYLWHRPEGYLEPLTLGQRSDTVKWVAQSFAQLDQREKPLTRNELNATLQERIKIFQRNYGLTDDGILGEQTLMKLNEVLGIDYTLNILD
ncbi:ExeA family protein [Teredinibacter waterburyi]|jgi:Type II secretory pathway, component ExeA (predicted ATPase)|uniref:ExeA family protein n=1 Tax=Teredinibacter waterburyi TaxID=1500538 RepID=UPI00165FB507|nr:ExeA family protein [Teredinibacter waterburyi]